MDRNSIIGLTLIAVLLFVYFNFFSPEPVKPTAPVSTADTTSGPIGRPGLTSQPAVYDSLIPVKSGGERTIRVENEDLAITFTEGGGYPSLVELKNFKTYYHKPLILIDERSNAFKLEAEWDGKKVDLYSLHYTSEGPTQVGDSTIVTFSAQAAGRIIKHRYAIPAKGFMMAYRLETGGSAATLTWNDFIPVQEKDIRDSRNKTKINYYLSDGTFSGLSDTSTDPESETLSEPVEWISVKQKFFSSAIIARKPFTGATVSTSINQADTSVVKHAIVTAQIPPAAASDFRFFFGPNDYSVLSDIPVSEFSKNLELGWPPVIWVNKFIIIPIFHFLEKYISNYGVIIMILVIIIKLLLAPLSYSSYLGMAKMRLLKPELDLIKEKNGDNMTQAQQDQMKLYQQAGVNPFSGCIPLLLQMPILFAMFYFFPVSVELRQQPFLWADDLSTYDSIAKLPFTIPFYGDHVSLFVLLMTASTLVYTWQNNQLTSVTGPMKSLSYIMPVVFMFILNTFSAGLSFYYFVSNLVTFAQQAIIKRFVDEDKIKEVMEDHKKKMQSGTSKKSSFMTKLEEAMKASEEAKKKRSR